MPCCEGAMYYGGTRGEGLEVLTRYTKKGLFRPMFAFGL